MNKLYFSLFNLLFVLLCVSLFILSYDYSIEIDTFPGGGVRATPSHSINFYPIIILAIGLVINYLLFKKYKVPTKHYPYVFTSSDEREQKIMNECASSLFYKFVPRLTTVYVIMMFIIYSVAMNNSSDVDQGQLLKLHGIVFISLLQVPFLTHHIMTLIKIRKV